MPKKINKYIDDFIAVCDAFIELKQIHMDAKEEFILIDPGKFKDVLKKFCFGDVNDNLKVFRNLNFIVTEENRFTIRRKINKSYKRFIGVRKITFDTLKELNKKC